MGVNVERHDRALIAKVDGRIDAMNASDFENSMREAIEEGSQAVIVNLASVSYISSAGLRAILLIAKPLSKRGVRFALCSTSRSIREVFEISGFDQIIAMYDSQDEALAAVNS